MVMERFEVFDDNGRRLGSVTSPREPGMFGPEKGTVYLRRPLPVIVPKPATPPRPAAHAA